MSGMSVKTLNSTIKWVRTSSGTRRLLQGGRPGSSVTERWYWVGGNRDRDRGDEGGGRGRLGWLLTGVGVAAGSWLVCRQRRLLLAEADHQFKEAGDRHENLPEFAMSEVSKHDSVENRVWVTFR